MKSLGVYIIAAGFLLACSSGTPASGPVTVGSASGQGNKANVAESQPSPAQAATTPLPPTPIVNPTTLVPPDSAANGAVGLLRKGDFARALTRADGVLANKPRDRSALVVRAFATYVAVIEDLQAAMNKNGQSTDTIGRFAHAVMNKAYARADKRLSSIQGDLALAVDKDFAFDLCVACWQYDWNGNGRIDDGDRQLFQLEIDHTGKELAKDDPRRRPVYRFDVGDIHWAQAMLYFQSGLLNLALAYEWNEIDKLLGSLKNGPTTVTIKLVNKSRVVSALAVFASALNAANQSRRAYLRETDDQREWVPNPSQRNHPMPFLITEKIYQTWGGVLSDLEQIRQGKTGIDLRELSLLVPELRNRPTGFLDLGGMLNRPKDMVFRVGILLKSDPEKNPNGFLTELLGSYHRNAMKASPITGRLLRMKRELDAGSDTLDRKLRYLLWLN